MGGFMIFRTLGNLLRLCLLSGLMVGLCGGQEKQSQKVPEASSTLSAGAELFTQHCAVCHGNDLKGNGLFPPPYRDVMAASFPKPMCRACCATV